MDKTELAGKIETVVIHGTAHVGMYAHYLAVSAMDSGSTGDIGTAVDNDSAGTTTTPGPVLPPPPGAPFTPRACGAYLNGCAPRLALMWPDGDMPTIGNSWPVRLRCAMPTYFI